MAYNPYPSHMGRYGLSRTVKPLWTVKFEEQEEFLDWFKDVASTTTDPQRELAERDLLNRDFYMGLQSTALGSVGIPRDKQNKPLDKFARVTINQCYELVEQWVAKMTRFAPAIAVIPPNQEYNDRIAAELSKSFIDYLFYVNDFDDIAEEVARNCRIDGEVFLFIDFDRTKGDLHPDYAQAQSLGIRVPLVDSEGKQIEGEDGEPLFIEKAQRVGDVRYNVVQRRYVIKQPRSKWKDVDWVILVESADIDELKAKHPDKADEIKHTSHTGAGFQDLFSPDAELNEVLTYKLYHRGTEFLDKGAYIKFTDSVVLEQSTLTEEVGHEDIPAVRLTNIDIPGICDGFSFLDQIRLLQIIYNNMASIAYTNMALGAHLYWMVPAAGMVDLKKLKNGSSVITYAGGQPPQIQQFKTVGPELFQGLEFINQSIQRISAIQGVSRGEPPQGIEAGVALAFLEEQENQRANTDIRKHNAFVKKAARLSLATAGAFYDASDGRTIRVVGKNNQFSIKALDVAKLGGPYDIRVQRTTALSESKSGRLSQILALEGRFPGMLPREQVLDMMDLANDKKYYDLATVAVQAAERENEMMAEGQEVMAPDEHEDHPVHLYTMLKFMQASSFKEDMPPERKVAFREHGMAHEYYIGTKMSNPLYAQRVMSMIPEFPVFMTPPPPPRVSMSPEPGMPLPPIEPMTPPSDEAGTPDPTDIGAQQVKPEPLPVAPQPPTEQPDQLPM